MKTVNDHPGFAAARDHLEAMRTAYTERQAEHSAILQKLNANVPVTFATATDRAAALLKGEPMPANRSEVLLAEGEREQQLRGEIELLHKALIDAPTRVEHERDKARVEKINSSTKQTDEIKAKWEAAQVALKDALNAENDFITELLHGGFGGSEPRITAPHWLNRADALEALR